MTAARGRRSLLCRLFGHKWGGVDWEADRSRGRRYYRWCRRCAFRHYEPLLQRMQGARAPRGDHG